MQMQSAFNSCSRLTPAIASLIAHGAVLGILLIASQLTSLRLQEKQVVASKTFTLISQDLYQRLPAKSSGHRSLLKHTSASEPTKIEKPPAISVNESLSPTASVESNFEKSNQNQAIDSSLHVAEAVTGQKEIVGNSSGAQGRVEKETSGYIDEAKIIGGLKAVFKPAVPYPQVAQDREIEGDVEVAFIVSPQGTVEDISILRTSHPIFISTVQRVVKSWRFKPAVVGGMPMRVKVVQNICFRLDE